MGGRWDSNPRPQGPQPCALTWLSYAHHNDLTAQVTQEANILLPNAHSQQTPSRKQSQPTVPQTGEPPVLGSQVRQSRERLDSSAI